MHQNLGLMGALGATDESGSIPLREVATAISDQITTRFGKAGYVVINLGAAWPNKRWPPDKFGGLAASIRKRHGRKSIVLAGPGEDDLARRVASASEGAAEASPPTSIPDLCAIVRDAMLMVSGDTGPMQIAVAVGVPIVALFGPTLPERNGPWRGRDVVVSRTAKCRCHYKRQCRLQHPCLDDIGIDEVSTAVDRRLAMRLNQGR